MGLTMKEGLAIVDRVTKKAAVGHIHSSHVTAFLEEIEKAVEAERLACETIARSVAVVKSYDGPEASERIALEIKRRA